MDATIEAKPEIGGNVKVTVECNGHAIVNVWKMTMDEAIREAEEIAARMGWKI
jgi:hypothetical protein